MEAHEFEVGQKVHYRAFAGAAPENGIVKSFNPNNGTARVVYKCAGNWDLYQNYTSACTEMTDLSKGWL